MFKDFRVGVVIPCYRVEDNIIDVIGRVPDFVDAVIAVNDASPDDTAKILASIKSERLTVLTHEKNQGVGGAMVTGFKKALEMDLDIVVKLDGDGQMDPAFMVELVEPVADGVCDYAKGNRFLHFDALRQMPLPRKIGNIALTFLTKVASGCWHTFDPQNGYVAIRSDYLRALDFDRLATRRYFFENEMLIRLNIETARILDCPMPSIYAGEVSSLRISQVLTYFPLFLLRGFFSRMFHRYILRDFSIVIPLLFAGVPLLLWGLGFGFWGWLQAGPDKGPLPAATVMLAVLPLIVGAQMLLSALLIDILQTPQAERPVFRRHK